MNIIIAILAGLFHGINEGMDMHQPNVRNHRWFWAYHRLYVVEAALLVWFGYRLYPTGIGLWLIPTALLANRAMEMAYSYTRSGDPFPDRENVLGTGFIVTGTYAHALRIILIAAGIITLFI